MFNILSYYRKGSTAEGVLDKVRRGELGFDRSSHLLDIQPWVSF